LDYISLSKEADEKFRLGKYEEAKELLEKGLTLAKRDSVPKSSDESKCGTIT
jgi:hypothetical protein